MKPINRQRVTRKRAEIAIRRLVTRTLVDARKRAISALDTAEKAASSTRKRVIAAATSVFDDDFQNDLAEQLEIVAKDGGAKALLQIDVGDDAIAENVNKRAAEWARQRAGELVKVDGDVSLQNVIKNDIARCVAEAEEEGWGNDKLADVLTSATGFSVERAFTIARTETAFADVQGNIQAYQESGVVKKWRWLTARDEKVSEACTMNSNQVVDLGAPFPSGAYQPPQHPNCRCDCEPLVDGEQE